MKGFHKVEGHSGLVKNPQTGTILNANTNEILAAKQRKLSRIEQTKEKEQLVKDVADLKDQMSEVMVLLKQMIEK